MNIFNYLKYILFSYCHNLTLHNEVYQTKMAFDDSKLLVHYYLDNH